MPTDPSLILNFAQNLPNLAPDPSKLLAQQLSADRLTVFAQQQEGQKALKDLYANPQNLDQQGRPTPQAMSRLMAAAPTEGLDLTQALTRDSTATAQLALMRAKEGDETIKQRYQIGLAADTAYRQAIANKLPPEQARKVGQDAFTEARDAAAPFLGPDVMNTIPTNYDPSRVARGLSAYQQLVLGPKGQLEMAKTAAEIERDKAETLRAGQQAVSAQFTDPHNVTYIDKDGKQKTDTARYDRVSDQWIKDGKPLNVIRIEGTAGSGGPKAMAFTAYMQAHPDATPEQQAEFIQSSGADGAFWAGGCGSQVHARKSGCNSRTNRPIHSRCWSRDQRLAGLRHGKAGRYRSFVQCVIEPHADFATVGRCASKRRCASNQCLEEYGKDGIRYRRSDRLRLG